MLPLFLTMDFRREGRALVKKEFDRLLSDIPLGNPFQVAGNSRQ